MKVGIDLRALQTGHKFRGIGEVTKQTTNRILANAVKDTSHDLTFIFFEYSDDDPKQLLTVPSGLRYEVVKLGKSPENDSSATTLDKTKRHYKSLFGQPIAGSKRCDVFLQFDYAFGVPKNTKTILIKHDLIPYIFWDKYFESAWVPFKNKAARTTIRTIFANKSFMRVLRRSLKNAHVILAVSESTKRDIETYFHTKPSKVRVAKLGVDSKQAKTTQHAPHTDLPTKPYLLFVGAGDARRRVEDAVAVFNNLKAKGQDIQLVLVGENFQSQDTIPNPVVRKAVQLSSYRPDILTLGYVNDALKQTLYKQAIAFLYPTDYEGFGIPVLESMLLDCPIISYKNSSIPEVGGDYAYYAHSWQDMMKRVEEIRALSDDEAKRRKADAKHYAEQFTWDKTADAIYSEVMFLLGKA